MKTDGSWIGVTPAKKRFSLSEMYRLIECSCISIIDVKVNGWTFKMVIDDEGKLKASAALNEVATDIYCPDVKAFYAVRKEMEAAGAIVISAEDTGFFDHQICGHVLLCAPGEI